MAVYNVTGYSSFVTVLSVGDIIDCSLVGQVIPIELPSGRFKIDCWGAAGGNSDHCATRSGGGFASGIYNHAHAGTVYLCVGGEGTNRNTNGGFNGGGPGVASTDSGAGGGATHVALRTGLLQELAGHKEDVLVVAGGAGGNGCSNDIGGAGGGLSGKNGDAHSSYGIAGEGGNQYTPGTNRSNTTPAGFGYGGTCLGHGLYGSGGGGAGWYGGSAGNNVSGGGTCGGGGSGHVSIDLTSPILIDGSLPMAQPDGSVSIGHFYNGFIRITMLGIGYDENYYNFARSETTPHLASVEITSSPSKVIYQADEQLDLQGLMLTAIFDDDTVEVVGFDTMKYRPGDLPTLTAGQESVPLRLHIRGYTVKVDLPITVL